MKFVHFSSEDVNWKCNIVSHKDSSSVRRRKLSQKCKLLHWYVETIVFHSAQNFDPSGGICCFAAEMSQAAEFRFFRKNCPVSGILLQNECFIRQFNTRNLPKSVSGSLDCVVCFWSEDTAMIELVMYVTHSCNFPACEYCGHQLLLNLFENVRVVLLDSTLSLIKL